MRLGEFIINFLDREVDFVRRHLEIEKFWLKDLELISFWFALVWCGFLSLVLNSWFPHVQLVWEVPQIWWWFVKWQVNVIWAVQGGRHRDLAVLLMVCNVPFHTWTGQLEEQAGQIHSKSQLLQVEREKMQMELSHKRARIELEKAANTNARNYEVSGMSAHGLGALAWARAHGEHFHQWFGLVWFGSGVCSPLLTCCALVCSGLSQNVYSYSFLEWN